MIRVIYDDDATYALVSAATKVLSKINLYLIDKN